MKNIVTNLPLKALVSASIPFGSARKRDLSKADIVELLRQSRTVQFIVVNVRTVPIEIPKHKCHDFWKKDVKAHIPISDRVFLDDFEGGYCYFASDWGNSTDDIPIVVLEKQH